MTDFEIRQAVWQELNNIAPEVDLSGVDPAADLREALDIDSMDFLTFVTAIHRRLGIEIAELDYPKLATLAGAVAYLIAREEAKRTISPSMQQSGGRS